MVQDMYINVLHIEPMTKTIYCTDAFGLNTKFKFDELVNINKLEAARILDPIVRHS